IASFTRRSWSADAPRLEPAAAARHESPEAIALVDAIQREADRLPVARDPERAPGAPDRPFVDEERFACQRPFPPHGASMYRSAYIELRIGIPTVTRGDEARSLSRNRGAPRLRRGATSGWGVWGAISGPPMSLEEAELRRLRRVVHIGDEPVLLGEAAEALPGLEHFRLVVLHVLVRTGGVPQARQLRRLVDGDARRAARDVIGDLIAGLDRAAARRGQFVGGGRRPQAGREALPVDFE